MRTIQKTISLEGFTSRLPSVVPAYKKNVLYCFNDSDLNARDYEYTSNYGMVPSNITISGFTSGDYGFAVDIVHSGNCAMFDSGMTTFSFSTISSWYSFFKDYYRLLKDNGHCKTMYSAATQYYDVESKNPKYSNDLVYGFDRTTYEELDETFNKRGGKVVYTTLEQPSGTIIIDVKDDGFYKFICDKIIPSFTIPTEYKGYWNRDTLYYPDVIKWIGWFSSRLEYETETEFSSSETPSYYEQWNCKKEEIENCCDCEEYFKRGGKRIYDAMTEWYQSLQDGIEELSNLVKENEKCFKPYMIQELSLTTSIDNLGEMSILSEEYEVGKDYRNADSLSADTNSKSGTTVVGENGESLMLISGAGFCYDSIYMEKLFKEDDWTSYTKKFIDDNYDLFKVNYKFYAYDSNNGLITGNTTEAIEANFYTYIPITYTDSVLINGYPYEVLKAERGVYNDKTYFVYRDPITNTPYTSINGRNVYADFYPYGEEPYYYFTIFKDSEYERKRAAKNGDRVDDIDDSFKENNYVHYPRVPNEEDLKEYISYKGAYYDVCESGATVNGSSFYRICGYAYGDDGAYYLISSGDTIDIYYTDELINVNDTCSISDDKLNIKKKNEYIPTIYSSSTITGTTVSKLDTLRSYNLLIDDIGNEINGLYNVSDKLCHQPSQGEELEPIYQVGNTYFGENAVYSNTKDRESITSSTSSDTRNYFVGDIITEMSFYYQSTNGVPNEDTRVTLGLDSSGNTVSTPSGISTSLGAISAATIAKESIESGGTILDPKIYCDVTYCMGATLSRREGEKFVLAYDEENPKYSYGVEYHETVNFIKTNTEYYLKKPKKNFLPILKNTADKHSVSYPVVTYELSQTMTPTETSYSTILVPLADFKSEISVWNEKKGTNSYDRYDGDISKKSEIYPTFMEEYNIGMASMKKIDADIFIDRGINSAFEKHIKLSEVATLEALENYGNGWFKMMDNGSN